MGFTRIDARYRGVPHRPGIEKNHQVIAIPAPIKGIDVTQQLAGADPLTAVQLINMIPRVAGCRLRSGYFRWTSNLDGEVRTLAPFIDVAGENYLFAFTSAGSLYDVTAATDSGTTPVAIETGLGGTRPGQWSYTNYSNDFGSWLVAVCAGAGMWTFDTTNGWVEVTQGTATGQIEGVDPALFDFVWLWKGRLWFIQNDTADVWYLPYGQVTGKVTKFSLGPLLPHGGPLAIGANWTFDGGVGMDDKLIFIGEQGDIVIYEGTDPDIADTFKMVGRWYIGRVPMGRRFASRFMADLLLVTEKGLSFITEILRGKGSYEISDLAQRINAKLAAEVTASLDQPYWEVMFVPHEQIVLINKPSTSVQDEQWVYEVNTKAFAVLQNYPALCVEVFNSGIFCGDLSGNVWQLFSGESDGKVDDVEGKDLEGVVITAFNALGEAIRLKRFLMVRPSFIAPTAPAIQLIINPDWSFKAPLAYPNYNPAGDSVWDTARWDNAVWSGSSQSYSSWVGVTGIGYYGSLSMRVRGKPGTTFVSWQPMVTAGGVL